MPDVVLLYDRDCPNVAACRTNLVKAFTAAGQTPSWRELDRTAEGIPHQFQQFGSPTILVDGADVDGGEPSSVGPSCRLYRGGNGKYDGTPSVERIADALRDAQAVVSGIGLANGRGWKQLFAVVPAVGTVLLPNITCPACWPAYGAILSSLGISFLPSNRVLLPVTIVFLALYLGLLVYDARKRRRVGPLVLGSVAAGVLIVGRFVLTLNALLYVGVILLVGASLWNAWLSKMPHALSQSASGGCPGCQSGQRTP